jgi:hypothetical protein
MNLIECSPLVVQNAAVGRADDQPERNLQLARILDVKSFRYDLARTLIDHLGLIFRHLNRTVVFDGDLA